MTIAVDADTVRHSSEWLGVVPGSWEVKRLKDVSSVAPSNVDKKCYDGQVVVRLCNYTDIYYNERITNDLDLMVATASPEEIRKFELRGGQVIITKDSESADDIGISAYVPFDLPGVVCGYHLSIIQVNDKADGRFIKRLFDSTYVKSMLAIRANGLTRVGLGQSALSTLPIPVPPVAMQRQIADFLDAHTAKIDALIGKQERLIETLAERRQAVISHAVTKGLDPNAPMKESGVSLVGDIPSSWQVHPLKRLVSRIEQGVSPQASAELADESSWGVVKSGCVNYGIFSDVQHKRLDDGFAFDPSIQIRKGDLLVCRASGSPRLVGSAAIVRELRYSLILSDKTFRLPVNPNQNAAFIEKLLNSELYRTQVRGAISGAAGLANNLPGSSLRQFVFPVPPFEEQAEIVEYLDRETAQIDALSAKAREMIDVLKERRQALISAAVTGKIDVRTTKGPV